MTWGLLRFNSAVGIINVEVFKFESRHEMSKMNSRVSEYLNRNSEHKCSSRHEVKNHPSTLLHSFLVTKCRC